MKSPVYYHCLKCKGQFPSEDYNFEKELCLSCCDILKKEKALMDAAPELLEALKQAVILLEDSEHNDHGWMEDIQSAIAKAKGE